jgi:2-methylisocitrate lyase-like PEP mutase family enzyme
VSYATAGAECLYAPGLTTLDQIATLVKAVSPLPVNVLAGPLGFTLGSLADVGVRRISIGGALARVAWSGVLTAMEEIVGKGSFGQLESARPFGEINALFAEASAKASTRAV